MKKLTIAKDFAPIIAKKSLFHAFRMNQFAMDIAQCSLQGKPIEINFHNPNMIQLYQEIVDDESEQWPHFAEKFKYAQSARTSSIAPVAFGR